MNLPTVLILALIGIALFAALRSMKKHPVRLFADTAPRLSCAVGKSEKHR